MNEWLLPLSLVVTAAVVLVLVVYLLGIIIALARAQASLKRLAGHLVATRDNTAALDGDMAEINQAMGALRDGLLGVNRNLEAIVSLAGILSKRAGDANQRGAGGAA